MPYASYEKTAFLNRLEYLANHASATYMKNYGEISEIRFGWHRRLWRF